MIFAHSARKWALSRTAILSMRSRRIAASCTRSVGCICSFSPSRDSTERATIRNS